MFNQPLRVHHYIVIDNEKDFAPELSPGSHSTYLVLPETQASVHSSIVGLRCSVVRAAIDNQKPAVIESGRTRA
jgi:hypothetical protein